MRVIFPLTSTQLQFGGEINELHVRCELHSLYNIGIENIITRFVLSSLAENMFVSVIAAPWLVIVVQHWDSSARKPPNITVSNDLTDLNQSPSHNIYHYKTLFACNPSNDVHRETKSSVCRIKLKFRTITLPFVYWWPPTNRRQTADRVIRVWAKNWIYTDYLHIKKIGINVSNDSQINMKE